MTIRIYTNNQIEIDSIALDLFVKQDGIGTIFYCKSGEIVHFPHNRYSLTTENYSNNMHPGLLQLELDIATIYSLKQSRNDIKRIYDNNPNMTLKELSNITNYTVKFLKFILLDQK